jgi:hypothetical protein
VKKAAEPGGSFDAFELLLEEPPRDPGLRAGVASDGEDASIARQVHIEDVRDILLVFPLLAAEQGHDARSLCP